VLIASLATVNDSSGSGSKKWADIGSLISDTTVLDLVNVVVIAVPATISVAIGTRVGSRMSDAALKLIFGATLAGIAPLILHKAYKSNKTNTSPITSNTIAITKITNTAALSEPKVSESLLKAVRERSDLALAGTLMGFITGLAGVGGGPIIISYLSLQTNRELSPRQVVGTANLSLLPMMIVGAATHALHGNIAWKVAAPLCAATMVGGAIGGIAAAYAPVQMLQSLLAGFLMFTGYSTSRKALAVLFKKRM
jgi:uncharacterized membrane protein YfcA